MATAIPPLQESEKIEFGGLSNSAGENANPEASKIVVASYNIRYAVGQFLISSGLLRKAGILARGNVIQRLQTTFVQPPAHFPMPHFCRGLTYLLYRRPTSEPSAPEDIMSLVS